jgi:hypothetical protein|tara:strand:+ start:10927 stop:11166 length:240 start_codon:yes stop_codon:yes gene_type:complete
MKKKKVVRRRRKKALPKQYKAPKGSKRAAMLRRASKLYKSGNKQAAFRLREEMERKEREKKKTSKKKVTRKKATRKKKR